MLLLYLEQAIAATRNDGLALTSDMLVEGIREDAVLRVRPKAMTVAVIVALRERAVRDIEELGRERPATSRAESIAVVDLLELLGRISDAGTALLVRLAHRGENASE